ncbi:amino acid adenylation domain-containing protein, partial [Flavobacterium sp. HJSW_4]|uniref:amino acid adenylation domain-containing protein n=1 Tax=Flavobacterium sp. HJSW_4 TaxID=3344660 RepID=UPI0035F40BAE
SYPFDELVSKLNLKRDISRSALFDVLVVLQNQSQVLGLRNEESLSGLQVDSYNFTNNTAQFDISFNFAELDGLALTIDYNTDIYDLELIGRMFVHFENLLAQCIEGQDKAIGSIDYLSQAERQQLLEEFNDTGAAYPKDKTIIDLFEEQADRTPNNIAVVFEGKELTYKEINEQSNQLGAYLRETYKIQAEDLIGIKLERSEQMIVAILGILKSGAAYVPIDLSYPQERIAYIEKDSNCKIVVDIEVLKHFNELKDRYLKSNVEKIITPQNLAYVIYTSGTTGNPKGVMIKHSNIVRLLKTDKVLFDFNPDDVWTMFHSYCFDFSVWEMYGALFNGSKLVIISLEAARNPIAFLNILIQERVTILNQTPSNFYNLLLEELKRLSNDLSLRFIIFGGESLNPQNLSSYVEKYPMTKLVNMYGITETTVHVTYKEITITEIENNISNIGLPIPTSSCYVLDENQNLSPVGVPGELYVGGEGLAKGYLNRDDLTSEKFIKSPFIKGETLYRSGDIVKVLKNGELEYLGRKDHQVKIRGFRIELGEIETAISQYSEEILQVIVEAKEINQEKALVAYYVSKSEIEKSEIRSYLQNKLPEYMVPSFYIEIESFLLTANGKVDRKALPNVTGQDIIKKEYVAPRNETEEKLAAIWQEVLGIEKIGITDNFFELGGHSLMIGQVVNRIYKQLGKTISFKIFFVNPTIKALSRQLKKSEYLPIPKATQAQAYPLTASQSRLWILSQLEGGSLAYNMPAAIKLTGAVDYDKFEESFKLLIHRHEILRTYFKTNEEGEINQYVLASDHINFAITEKDFTSEEDQQGAIAGYLKQTKNEPFHLEHAPLIRASLLKLKAEEYVFSLSMHHIIGDGWSLEILISEIASVYNALKEGVEITLPELRIQYKDYAVWLNESIDEEKHQMAENYWLEQFSGELPVLDLPSFKSRPVVQTYNGSSFNHRFSKSFLEQLKGFSQSEDVTLFMTLMTGIKVLLYRYTGQNDIIVGTPIAGRDHPDLENQLGLYLNILGIRTRFNDKDSFIDLLNQQKNTLLGAYEHQNYPFDALLDKLNLKRDTSRSALFDVLVVLQNQNQLNSLSKENLNNIKVDRYDLNNATSKFDVSFTFIEIEEGLDLVIEYNTDIYDTCLIERMFSHLENILSESMTDSGIAIADINYLTVEEKQCLMLEFNNTVADYEKDKTIIDLFEEQVARTPDNIGVIFEDKEISYKTLNEQSNQLGSYLRERYLITSDDLVGIKIDRSEQMLIALLGILKSGAAYVPIDINYPEQRIDYIQNNSNCKVLVDADFLKGFYEIQEKYSKSNLVKINKANDLAYVIYTSGTTGNPKGVMVEHRNVINFLSGMSDSISLKKEDHLLAITSISFDISILELFWTLTKGITVTLKGDNTTINNFNSFLKDYSETLDFSLFYFSSQDDSTNNKYQFLKESAFYADKNNFSAIWLPERHFHEFGGIFPNPSVLAAGLSTITENIEIRSGSVVLPLHDVVRVAEEWAVVDNLSNGRVALSIASGWHADDFVLNPENFLNRHEIMYRQIEELRRLWEGDSIKRKNGLDKEIDIKIYPKPFNSNLEIYITSGGNSETFRSAGKIGANILTHLLGQEIKDLRDNIKIYKQSLAENGFSTEKAKISLMLHTYIGTDIEEVRNIVKEPFKSYLKSSVGLIQKLASDLNRDITKIKDEDLNDLLELAFERYWQTSALLGTKESCKEILSSIYSIGVTEIACLVDFGIKDEDVLNGLENLTELKNNYKRSKSDKSSINPITTMQITPSYLEALLEDHSSRLFLKSLKNIIVGGEKFPERLLNNLRLHTDSIIYNMYGPTETTIWSTFQKAQENAVLNIGKPIQNTQIYILDDNKELCPIGVKGYLYIGGDGLARGYYKEEKLTADKFIQFSSSDISKIIYKTGDLARWLPDGTLEYLGRLDNQVKINGFRIELEEIENTLLTFEGINKTVVIANKNEVGSTNLMAYYVGYKTIDSTELKEYLHYKLPYYMVPNHFIHLDEIPLTPNGKIDRKALPSVEALVIFKKEYVAPKNNIEIKLIEIWQNVLGIEKIGIKDNFFDLGGNSLLIIKMLNAINKEFQTNITLMEGFNLPNIYAISEHIYSNFKNGLSRDNKESESKTDELYRVMEESYNLLNFDNNES